MSNLEKNEKYEKEKTLLTKTNKKRLAVSLSIFVLVLLMVIGGLLTPSQEPSFVFQNGTYIAGEQVSGYSIQKASEVISNQIKEKTNGIDIEIIYKDKVWKFNQDDLEIDNSIRQVVQKAYNSHATRLNSQSQNNSAILNGLIGNNYKVSLKNIFKNFDEKIDNIISEIEVEPQNASVEFLPDEQEMFKINKSKLGVKVNREKLMQDLDNQFLKTKEIKVYITTKAVKPEIDESYFDNKLNLMSSFKTSLKNSQEGRRENVKLALSFFNGKVVKKGEKVSFNQVTGPQTTDNGYKNAIIILNGKYVEGIGGGICQASTTLYNACVLANLEINEVHKHTLPVGYVELSLDAMVNEGYSDMVFTNNSDDDIYIKSFVSGDDAVVEIYGNSIPNGCVIKRVAEFIENIPHNGDKIIVDEKGEYTDKVIYKGEYYRLKYPQEGYEAKAYKETYKDGELIKREEIRHEKYQPVDGIVIEGSKEPPKEYVIPQSDVEIIKPQAQNNR